MWGVEAIGYRVRDMIAIVGGDRCVGCRVSYGACVGCGVWLVLVFFVEDADGVR